MKERFSEGRLMLNPPNPALGVIERAWIECGCEVFVGARLDNMEAATMANSCSRAHDQVARHFTMLLAESTVDPTDDPLIDVCERLLEEAAHYVLDHA